MISCCFDMTFLSRVHLLCYPFIKHYGKSWNQNQSILQIQEELGTEQLLRILCWKIQDENETILTENDQDTLALQLFTPWPYQSWDLTLSCCNEYICPICVMWSYGQFLWKIIFFCCNIIMKLTIGNGAGVFQSWQKNCLVFQYHVTQINIKKIELLIHKTPIQM